MRSLGVLSVVVALFVGFSLAQAPSSLRLVHLVFRHGDRSPTQTFPTDPHQESAWPQGFGQLTQIGMQQEYDLGKYLRKHYNGFLNETYIRQEVYVRSTDNDRTLMSASSVLAGLYPPRGHQLWNPAVRWQPIPIHTVVYATDNLLRAGTPCQKYFPWMQAAFTSPEVQEYEADNKLLSYTDTVCPTYTVLLDEVYQSNETLTYEENNKEFLEMVRKESGLRNADLYDLMEKVPNSLFCEKEHNMTLPDWVTEDVFNRLQALKDFQIKLWFYTPEMQKIRAGVFLNLLVNQTRNKAGGTAPAGIKVYMYSAHDTTLAAIMMALDDYNWLLPPYSSTLMFELHQRPSGHYFVKLTYKNDSSSNQDSVPIPLSIRGCAIECDLDQFYRVIKPMVYEGDWFADCENKAQAISIDKGAPIAIAVFAIIIIIVLLVVAVMCYKKKSGEIAYQSANFSSEPGSA